MVMPLFLVRRWWKADCTFYSAVVLDVKYNQIDDVGYELHDVMSDLSDSDKQEVSNQVGKDFIKEKTISKKVVN